MKGDDKKLNLPNIPFLIQEVHIVRAGFLVQATHLERQNALLYRLW